MNIEHPPEQASKPHILVIDDDDRIRQLLTRFLQENGFVVNTAVDAESARAALKYLRFDALILDIMMPGESGLDFLRALRKTNDIPVLMLTALGETEDKLEGFNSGVDDYLPKPFEPRELVARLLAILKRRPKTQKKINNLRMGRWVYDADLNLIRSAEETVRLTDAEGSLLKALARFNGDIVHRDTLSQICELDPETRAIDVQVTRLRRKLEDEPKKPQFLFTVRGKGYRLLAEPVKDHG